MQLRRYFSERSLGWHLIWIVLLKITILYVLWLIFIQPNKIKVDQNDLDCLYSSRAQMCSPHFLNSHKTGEKR